MKYISFLSDFPCFTYGDVSLSLYRTMLEPFFWFIMGVLCPFVYEMGIPMNDFFT